MGMTAKMATLVGTALLGLVGVAAAFYAGDRPDWAPVAALLWELITAGAAGALSFPIMEKLKSLSFMANANKLVQSYVHVGIATVLGPLAWVGLIALDLTEVSPRGAMMVAAVAFGTGKQIWQHYKNKVEEKIEKAAEEAKPRIRERLAAYTGKIPQGHSPGIVEVGQAPDVKFADEAYPLSAKTLQMDTDTTDYSCSGDVQSERGPVNNQEIPR